MPGQRARLGGNALLHIAIAAQTNYMLIENFVLVRVKTRGGHLRRHGNANCVAYALTERPCRAFHSRRFTKFRVPRCPGMQLPEPFDLRHRQIIAAHVQPCVKKHAAMPAREDEDIAINPARLIRIVFQSIAEQDRSDLRAAERQPEMPRLRRLHSVHAQTARLSRSFGKNFSVQTHTSLYARQRGIGMSKFRARTFLEDQCRLNCQIVESLNRKIDVTV